LNITLFLVNDSEIVEELLSSIIILNRISNAMVQSSWNIYEKHWSELSQKIFKLFFKINGYQGAIYDIPEEFDDSKVYNSTLGHKVNNAFLPLANTDFAPIEHPRYGKTHSTLR
jgi:hypothetical protein